MKVKRTVAMMVILVGLFCVFAPAANAVPGWYVCTIDMTNMQDGYLWLAVTHATTTPAFTNKYVLVNPTYRKEIMAIALTAMASNMQLSVYFDPAASPYPITNAVQLAAQ